MYSPYGTFVLWVIMFSTDYYTPSGVSLRN
ncbi:hypothetical protein SAMN05444671_1366 [Flavobacterium sp. CF108]|nr:hypothetical protein SAMN05444671_1366 [Flavobacterium sp. CF108]